jgi:peptide/nickel transport system substrate-binding protein
MVMHRKNLAVVILVMVLASLLLVQCAPAKTEAPTQVAPTKAPVAAAAPTSAPAPTAVPTKAPVAAPTTAPAAAPTAAPAAAPTKAPAAPVAATAGGQAPVKTGKYGEAPILAEQVKAGKLPSVDKRLPDEPMVVPMAEKTGLYGGTWRRGFLGPSDANNYVRIVYDALVRFTPDGGAVEPKLIKSWENTSDFTQWTLKMLKGAKWSDGSPFTSDDIMFWYTDVLLNKDLTPALPAWMKNKDGSAALVEKIDDYTVRFTYKNANNLFLQELANKDGGDRSYAVFLPSAYLKQFHAKYVAKDALDKLVADAKYKTWAEMFISRATPVENIARPTMAPWTPSTRISDQIMVLKRNPYYVGVDPDGNQLPYIDEVDFVFFNDAKTLNMAAIAGDFDEIERHVDMTNYPVLKENEAKLGKYRIMTWPGLGGADANIIFNQTYNTDPALGELLRNKDFRIAMSYAINRDQIKEAAFLGLGEGRQSVPGPDHPYYPGDEYAFKYTKMDQAQANKLLDGLGLDKKDADGIRLRKDGKKVMFDMSVVAAFGPWPDVAQMVAKDWEKVGVKVNVQIRERALHLTMRDSNQLQTELWNTNAFPFTGNPLVDPRATTTTSLGPLYKQWYTSGGKEGMEPSTDLKRVVEIIDSAKSMSTADQIKAGQELYRLWATNIWEIGTVGRTAMVQGVVIVNSNLKNVPAKVGNDWPLRTPGNARTEQFFFAK